MMKELIHKLRQDQTLSDEEFKTLLETEDVSVLEYLYENARQVREQYYGKKVYTRGLIEFTNYCRNNCYYCGIRKDNRKAERYRLSKEDIYVCVQEGYKLGFRTFVLQGGEDGYYTKEKLGEMIRYIKQNYFDCAVTLSFGEWDRETYQYWYDCGADRYLLRHETADPAHYRMLHPQEMSLSHRKKCLKQLKEIGYQVGAGFMVGSPGQTLDTLVEDLRYMELLQPHMAGIGPFIPQKDTPFAEETAGTYQMTIKLLAILRLMFPKILLPATTALGTIHSKGREMGILAGANVVMPNLSPVGVREKYNLYDNKICTGDEAAECRQCLDMRMHAIGYELCVERGDSLMPVYERSRADKIELSICKKFHKSIFSRFAKAINEYEMLREGDKVAVCISGGKDSMLMAKCFQELQRHRKFQFELVFLVMDPGYCTQNRNQIEQNAQMMDIPLTIFETQIFNAVDHIEKSPCYLCARMRRGYLYNKARELGCNKIALGHHYDDVIETILMGMLYGGQVQTMMPKLHSTNFKGMELIRPMYLVREDDIRHWRDYNDLQFLQCACHFTDQCTNGTGGEVTSKRQEVKELIRSLKQTNPYVENNIFKSVENVNLSTLIAYKKGGVKHHFLDTYENQEDLSQ